MRLNFINRFNKYIERLKDISIIEIKESDEIFKDIKFLDYDLNYQNGYALYIKMLMFLLYNTLKEKMLHVLVGKLLIYIMKMNLIIIYQQIMVLQVVL